MGAKHSFHVLAISVPLAPAFEGGGLSSFITIVLYTASLEEVSKWRPSAHVIFKVLALKIKDHGTD